MPKRRAVWHFLRKETDGVAAIEFAILVPVLVLLLVGVIQAGALFFLQNNMASVAHDTARRVSVGELTVAAAPAYAQGKLVNWGVTFNVMVTEPGNDVSAQITVPMADAAILDIGNFFSIGNLAATAVLRKE